MDFFRAMPRKTFFAGILFVLAKMCGLIGVIFGFGNGNVRLTGGSLILTAFVLIIFCLGLCFKQLKEDRDVQENENEVQSLNLKLQHLKKEIEELETKRSQKMYLVDLLKR